MYVVLGATKQKFIIQKLEILFKNLSKDEFEFVWGKLYTSYINALNKDLTYELISENSIMEQAFNLEPSF